jgi:RimJ/RimL family protein N-acetyltransferase
VVRRWQLDDAPALHEALIDSLDHLRPWMPWAVHEPRTLAEHAATIAEWVTAWDNGDEFTYAITDPDGRLIGACGLHRRLGPDALEIGYWVRATDTGRGVATAAAEALTNAAFTLAHIDHVEIHHDIANIASGRVPHTLGYTRVAEFTREPAAPAEVGTVAVWRRHRTPSAHAEFTK